MIDDRTTPADDDAFAVRLAEMDEALAAGQTLSENEGQLTPPDLRGRLRRGMHALQALNDLRAAAPSTFNGAEPTRRLAPPDTPLITRIGRFVIERELGRGGFGVVFLAHDPTLHRSIALKVPHAQALMDGHLRERFHREAQAAAGLDHPNLVAVHEVGDAGPVCYIAAAYCPGPNLAAWLSNQPAVTDIEAARFVATLADAVHYAHENGVVHRDLKPANVLLACTGFTDSTDSSKTVCLSAGPAKTLDQCQPKITDFGLAKLMDDPEGVTKSGSAIGTPGYMAPEQAGVRGAVVGPAADVYALGAILYELLTGRPPFRGESDVETLRQVCELEPVSPRKLRPGLARDLETICLKCLEKDAGRRYESAATLAEDLRRFADGKPIVARPVGMVGRSVRWCKRKPVIAGLAAALVIAIGLGAAGVASEYGRANREKTTALSERDRSDRLHVEARDTLGEMIDLGHNLVHRPETVSQGLEILTIARRYHNGMLTDDPNNAAVREKAVTVCRRLALITGEKGDQAAAESAWREASSHCDALVAGPDGEKYRSLQVGLLNAWAEQLYVLGQYDSAIEVTQRALPIVEAVVAAQPGDPAGVYLQANTLHWRGNALRKANRWPEAASAFHDGIALIRSNNPAYTQRYGVIGECNLLMRLTEGHLAKGELKQAEKLAREGIAILRPEIEKKPKDNELPMTLGATLSCLGRALWMQKQWQASVDTYRESNGIFAARPDFTKYSPGAFQGFQRAAANIGSALSELGRGEEAIPDLLTAINFPIPPARIGRINPAPAELFECYARLVLLTTKRGDKVEAKRLLDEGLSRIPNPGNAETERYARLLKAIAAKAEEEAAAAPKPKSDK